MEAFTKHTGKVAVLDRANVDTDQIIPSQFLKRIERTGFGPFLFYDWRYQPDGSLDPDFELNHPNYENATILVTRRNFGSGSSREHAVWALDNYGIKALVAPSFADIFHKNSFDNGLVPVLIEDNVIDQIMVKARKHVDYMLSVDLESCMLSDNKGFKVRFVVHSDPSIHKFRRHCLLEGLDEISLTLRHEEKITAYEKARWPNPRGGKS